MAVGGASRARPFRPEQPARAAVDDQRPAPRGQLEGERRGMGIGRGLAPGRGGGVKNEGGAPGVEPRKAHGQARPRRRPRARGAKRGIKPALGTTAAAMEAGKPAIGMAQRAQGGGDAGDGIAMRPGRGTAGGGQRIGGPDQQGEDLEEFLGVARRDAARGVDLAGAVARQRLFGGAGEALHPAQREPGIDQPGQRLEARQAGRGRMPAPREKQCLLRQCPEEQFRGGAVAPVQDQERVVDHPDQPPPGQLRRPARPLARAIARDPVEDPVLRPFARGAVADGGKVVKPGAAVQLFLEGGVGHRQVPDLPPRPLDQVAREQEVAGNQLPAAGEGADGARLGMAGEAGCRAGAAGAHQGEPVERACPPSAHPVSARALFRARHGCRGASPFLPVEVAGTIERGAAAVIGVFRGSGGAAQAGDEEAVHAAEPGPEVGPQPQRAGLGAPGGLDAGQIGRLDGEVRVAFEERGKLRLALLGQKRAGAEDQHPARRDERERALEQRRLQREERLDPRRILDEGQIGVAPDRAGGRAGRVQKHGVEGCGGLPVERVGGDGLGLQAAACEVLAHPFHPRGRDVERGDLGPHGRELQRLAAGCGAEIEHPRAGGGGEHLRRHRRRRVLHPPGALGKARQFRDLRAGGKPQRAGGQQRRTEPLGPALGIGLHAQIDRRAGPLRCLHVLHRDLAPGRHQPATQPARQGGLGQARPAVGLGRDLAQHGIDEAGVALGPPAARVGQLDRGADHAMRLATGAELDRGEPQQRAQVGGGRLAQVRFQHRIGARQGAQRGDRQALRPGAVGRREARKHARLFGKRLVRLGHPGDQCRGRAARKVDAGHGCPPELSCSVSLRGL
ncbi:hypothetical protein SDC9_06341 [bioreactor metagenome]|uniref:Uncharacterized protein n=1 Tax=bioreactor metagenome TaxID=1076179 RepID=A0A644T1Y5_9ZZZZ